MNTREQFFRAGDKVVRVAYAHELGLHKHRRRAPESEMGRVLCVENCWTHADGRNRVTFVGFSPTLGFGFYACCFRRIEEIQLCVRTAEKFKQNEEVEV